MLLITGGSLAFWSVIVVALLVALVAASVRRVGADELVVVVRGGRVARTALVGLAVRVPGLETFEVASTREHVLPLVARARTRDGTEVVVLADLTMVVEGFPGGESYDDPVALAVRRAEEVLAQAVAGRAVEELGVLLTDDHTVDDGAPGLLARVDAGLGAGTRATDLEVTEVEARLTSRLARVLGRRGGAS